MATNKRKEAAALFELIEKSTLKVPKAGGNLKIPGWWSDKTNPTNQTNPGEDANIPDATAVHAGVAAVAETPAAAAAEAASGATEPASEATAPAPEATPQTRLYEPPPANVTPTSSPSIRPPQAPVAAVLAEPEITSPESGAASATVRTTQAFTSPSAARGAKKGGGGAALSGGAVLRGGAPVLIPPTVGPGRKTWVPPRPGTFARVPLWAIGFVMAAVLLLIVGGAVLVGKMKSRGAINPGKGGGTTTVAGVTTNAATSTERGRGVAAALAKVHDGGTVARSKDLYYVVVYTTPAGNVEPKKSTAFKHAQFLADHGVDVSIERVELPVRGATNRTESWYWVVTVKGYGSATEAKPDRDDIVKIGDQLSPGAWKNAYARNGLSMSAEAPR